MEMPTEKGAVRSSPKRLAGKLSQADNSARLEEKNTLDAEIVTLKAAWDVFTKQIAVMNAKLTKVSANLETFTKDRRSGEVSVYTEADRIFQRHGANRSYYFGCQFQGKDIHKIMDKSDELFGSNGTGGELRMMFNSHVTTKGLVDTEKEKLLVKRNEMCDNIGLGLKLRDGALAGIHATVPDNDHCNRTQDQIDKAIAHTQHMGISGTPKMHGMEMHVVNQMQNTPGGIGRMMEHWIKQYHQIGYRLDVAYC